VAVQTIRLFGDPILTAPAAAVTTFDKELRKLVKDLTETMLDAPGVGLAAPQIGVSLRVFTYDVDDVVGHLINPVLDLSDEEQDGEEGCLSLPGLAFEITRPDVITMKGLDLDGNEVVLEGDDLLARMIQHEIDHLDGVLLLDRVEPEVRREALREMRTRDFGAHERTPRTGSDRGL